MQLLVIGFVGDLEERGVVFFFFLYERRAAAAVLESRRTLLPSILKPSFSSLKLIDWSSLMGKD
jgi:hypothetical protein